MSGSDKWEGLSTEIGPPLFPSETRSVAGSAPTGGGGGGGLLRGLFGLAPPNSHSQMVSRGSFASMDFCGGEEDAQDAWRDKWEAHRRSSVDETRSPRTSPLAGAGAGASAPWSIPARPRSGDVWAVSAGRGGAGGKSFGSLGSRDDPMSVSSSGASTPSRLSLGSDPRVHGLGGAAGSSHPPVDVLRSKFFGGSYPPGPVGR